MKQFCFFRSVWKRLFYIVAVSAVSFHAAAQTPRLIVSIDSTEICPSGSGFASVYLTNPVDSIGGFELLIQVNRPDLISVSTSVDTVGSVIAGFEFVSATSPAPGTSIRIVALANGFGEPVTPALAPSTNARLLFRFAYTAFGIPDTTSDRTTLLTINSTFGENFGFSNQNGQLLGIAYRMDTTEVCYRCTQWLGSQCLTWVQVPNPPCDTTEITVDTIAVLDTTQVKMYNGAVVVESPVLSLGDINNDTQPFTIADLTELLRYISDGFPPLVDLRRADLNGDCRIDCQDAEIFTDCFTFGCPGLQACVCDSPVQVCCCGMRGNANSDQNDGVTISDLTFLVSYLFAGGTAPRCFDEANVNGFSSITIQDITALVSFLFNSGPAPANCP